MSFEQRYAKLNEQQKKAVDTLDGPVMVIAGPGSGKTELLSLRVANILRSRDVSPSQILCLTFTDEGAKNMQERLLRLIGMPANEVAISTFHGFALDIAHRFGEDFYKGGRTENINEAVSTEMMAGILEKLPLSDPLSKTSSDGYVYLKESLGKIGSLKKAGITPEELLRVTETNRMCLESLGAILLPAFQARISMKFVRDTIPAVIDEVRRVEAESILLTGLTLPSMRDVVVRTLTDAYEKSVAENTTKNITTWKAAWFDKVPETKELRMRDIAALEKNLSLVRIYASYRDAMIAKGYIDFDDMIIDLIRVFGEKPGILEQIREQYRYILVDEFQDTNDAQMRILYQITGDERPNILVVGDDDQAIYKFQGAELNNILQFRKRFPGTVVISMVKNYRSTNAIVDFAQKVVSQGTDRLVDRMRDIDKKLEAANPSISGGAIIVHEFETVMHEREYVASEIARKNSLGVPYSNMAIISRKHNQLQEMANLLQARGIPVEYEKKRNVLDDPRIMQIVETAKLIQSIADENEGYLNHLMPIILLFPFWDLERGDVWELSIEAKGRKGSHGRWMDIMIRSGNPRLREIARFLLDLSAKARVMPLSAILPEIIGPSEETLRYTSPFWRFYFSEGSDLSDKASRILFLSGLQTLQDGVRSFTHRADSCRLSDFVQYIDMHRKNGIQIINKSTYSSGTDAVKILTAHRSKGLEFDTVFVMHCQKKVWMSGGKSASIRFPSNLRIEPARDDMNDHLRLFFVALTRAQRHLYATGYLRNTEGKNSARLPFIERSLFSDFPHPLESVPSEAEPDISRTLESAVLGTSLTFASDEESLLRPRIDSYRLSVSHLNTFLDTRNGGPAVFFERNLLGFPQESSPDMVYGNAIHATFQWIYVKLKRNGIVPGLPEAQGTFATMLAQSRDIKEDDIVKYLDKGRAVLAKYYSKAYDRFDAAHSIETDFSTQHVMIEDIQITGKIDKIVPRGSSGEIDVYDFKTGKPVPNWTYGDSAKKILLHGYRRQLIFYKLLVEASKDYRDLSVRRGHLEFLHPDGEGVPLLPYDMNDEDTERLRRLIVIVGRKIRSLDFPDITSYEKSIDGVMRFEEDLLNGII